MSTITESEKKRLQSLKEKKQAFKAKGQFLQQALRNLDNITKHKKIIFNDDIDEQQSPKSKKKKRDLLDSDNDSDNDNEKDSLWNKDEFSIKENKPKKTILGNDTRFTLDDRFVKNDDQTEKIEFVEGINECDLQKEKEMQLDILENILGAPLTVKNQETKTAKKKLMIRYDPTENGHGEYEVISEQPKIKEKNSKKKKRDKLVSEMEPIPPEPEVSTDIYYTMSDTLTESLKQKEEFSLLKAHRKKDDAGNAEDCSTSIMENNKTQKFKLNFNATNAFKYDSSDADEDLNEVLDTHKQMADEVEENTCTNCLFEYKDTLFLDNEDMRFSEAMRFFITQATSNDEFKNLRRELKIIVRTKIRTNERKHQPWNKKKKIKRFKK